MDIDYRTVITAPSDDLIIIPIVMESTNSFYYHKISAAAVNELISIFHDMIKHNTIVFYRL